MTPGADKSRRFLEMRLLLSAFFAMGVMTFAFIQHGGAFYDLDDSAADVVRGMIQVALAVFSLPVLLLLGIPILRGAWLDLTQGLVRMDGLIVLATSGAWLLSVRNSLSGEGDVYYDTAAMVLVLVVFGRRLEVVAREKGASASRQLETLLPPQAHRQDETGAWTDLSPLDLKRGDRVRVEPGESVPADLRILEGDSEIMAAHLTGESKPLPTGPGRVVPAGAVNGFGTLVARVEETAAEGSLARIRHLLEAPLEATRSMRLADRIAGWLFALTLCLAGLAWWWGWTHGGSPEALERTLSVLLVACPCALGLAIPLAYRAARAALVEKGILVRDIPALERAASIRHVVLDKTGTLTMPRGRLRSEAGASSEDFLKLASLVHHSRHPLAATVESPGFRPNKLRVHTGAGVEGEFDGRFGRAGSPHWLDAQQARWPKDLAESRHRHQAAGDTLIAYAEDGEVRALGVLRQELRPSAEEAIAALRAQGHDITVLSGDTPQTVRAITERLGIHGLGGLSPEEKLARIRKLEGDGLPTLVVGDGVNDAPALKEASVGVAMGSGTEAARAHGDIEILDDDLRRIPLFLATARRLRRVVRGNLAWTLAYNTVAFGLAVSGRLNPIAAAGLMIASSLVVSLRSLRFLDDTSGTPA